MGCNYCTAVSRALGHLAARRHRTPYAGHSGDDGFTLIELMVVLLVMGILMAIAIPTFLGVTGTANDRSMQSNLTNAMETAKVVFARQDTYPKTATMVAQLNNDEPVFHFQSTASSHLTQISVATATTSTGLTLEFAGWMTKTKICWLARDTETTSSGHVGVQYNYNAKVAATGCTAKATGTVTTWTTKYPTPPAGH